LGPIKTLPLLMVFQLRVPRDVKYYRVITESGMKDKNSFAFGSKVRGLKLTSGRKVLEMLDK